MDVLESKIMIVVYVCKKIEYGIIYYIFVRRGNRFENFLVFFILSICFF